MTHPLVTEAMKKAPIAWISVAGGPAVAAWCLPVDSSLYLVTGPGEQAVPGLATATQADVTLRGDHGGRIVTFPAVATRVHPGGSEWDEVAPQLAGKRLNAPGDAESVVARWARECTIIKLTPSGDPTEAGPTLPRQSLAEPPRDTPVRRRTRRPFRLHRVRRR